MALSSCVAAVDDEFVQQKREALTESLTFQYPAGVSLDELIIAGNNAIRLNDRVTFQARYRALELFNIVQPAAVGLSSGIDWAFVNVGVNVRPNRLISDGKVELRSYAYLPTLAIHPGTRVEYQQGAGVGSLLEWQLQPAQTRTFTFEAGNPSGDVILTNSQQRTLTPGNYGRLHVHAGARVTLRAGDYLFDSFVFEPGSELVFRERRGPVRVFVRGELVWRGNVQHQLPGPGNILIAHGNPSETALIDRPFRGVLVSKGVIVINTPPDSGLSIGAFHARGIEVHQDVRLAHQPYRPISGLPEIPDVFEPLQDFPFNRGYDHANGMQGVTTDGEYWYFSGSKLEWDGWFGRTHKSRLWKVHISENLNDTPTQWSSVVDGNHYGDLTYRPSDQRLYVPIERGGTPNRVWVFDTDLRHVGSVQVPASDPNCPQLPSGPIGCLPEGAQADFPWLAYHPGEDLFYSSRFGNPESEAWHLNAYRITGSQMEHVYTVPFHIAGTGNRIGLRRIQGGHISDNGVLYLASDTHDGGVLIVDPETGAVHEKIPVQFDPGSHGGEDEELEGIVVWDVDALPNKHPSVHGQIHLIMIDNDRTSNSDFYFKHFRVDRPDLL